MGGKVESLVRKTERQGSPEDGDTKGRKGRRKWYLSEHSLYSSLLAQTHLKPKKPPLTQWLLH
jgi:hypothetical protein